MREAGGVPVRRIICCSWFMSKASELRGIVTRRSKGMRWLGQFGRFVRGGGHRGGRRVISELWQSRMMDYLHFWMLNLSPWAIRELLWFIAHVGKKAQQQNKAIRKTHKGPNGCSLWSIMESVWDATQAQQGEGRVTERSRMVLDTHRIWRHFRHKLRAWIPNQQHNTVQLINV